MSENWSLFQIRFTPILQSTLWFLLFLFTDGDEYSLVDLILCLCNFSLTEWEILPNQHKF